MTHDIQWSALARADFLSILDVISDVNPSAAQRLKDTLEAKINTLAIFPQMGKAGRVEHTRELVALANYIVVYQPNDTHVRVLRVLHAAQMWP